MHKAKKHEGQYCAGETHMVAISANGGIALFDDNPISTAENFGEEIDRFTKSLLLGLLSGFNEEWHTSFIGDVSARPVAPIPLRKLNTRRTYSAGKLEKASV
jgi:hypothetical protein